MTRPANPETTLATATNNLRRVAAALSNPQIPEGQNPSHLSWEFWRHLEPGRRVEPEEAIRQWNRSPYEPGSDNDVEFHRLQEAAQIAYNQRYLTFDDVPIIRMPSKRRMPQPTLKFDFETLHDIRLRLLGTGIFVGSKLYRVHDVVQLEDDYLMLLKDGRGKQYKCFYKKTPEIDLRSPEPQYFVHYDRPVFLMRPPFKQQQQGINSHSLYAREIGTGRTFRGELEALQQGLTSETINWSPAYIDLMCRALAFRALRLSKDVAVYRDQKDGLKVEYKGRLLGDLNDDEVKLDDCDYSKPWIARALGSVGCRVTK